jgi:hypothetical protein
MKKIIYIIPILLISLYSCSDMNDNFQKYLDKGEIIYTGTLDSLKTYGGYKKIQLNWMMNADSRIKEIVILWNQKKDSTILIVDRSAVDKVGFYKDSVILNNMNEGSVTFQVYTRDGNGHKSVVKEITGQVYGDTYKSSVGLKIPRILYSQTQNGKDYVLAFEKSTDELLVTTYLTYYTKTSDGSLVEKTIEIPNNETSVTLENDSIGTWVKYHGVFLPGKTALEGFNGKEESFQIPIYNDGWNISADSQRRGSQAPNNLLDGNVSSCWYSSTKRNYPHWIYLDLGHDQSFTQLYLWNGPYDSDTNKAYIEVSEDGNTWSQVNVKDSSVDSNGHYIFALTTKTKLAKMVYSFPQVTCRYFRITFTEGTASWATFGEIMIAL